MREKRNQRVWRSEEDGGCLVSGRDIPKTRRARRAIANTRTRADNVHDLTVYARHRAQHRRCPRTDCGLLMSVHHIGTGFLGDVQRQQRIFGTPPASPPAHTSASSQLRYSPMPEPLTLPTVEESADVLESPKISPEVSLDLRLRWLEALVFGSKDTKDRRNASRAQDAKNQPTLVRGVTEMQQRLSGIVQTNDGLKRFMDHCELLQLDSLLQQTPSTVSLPSFCRRTACEPLDPDVCIIRNSADVNTIVREYVIERTRGVSCGDGCRHTRRRPRPA